MPAQADSAITVSTTNFGAGIATNLGISLTGFDETQSYQATVKFVNNATSSDVANGVLAATPGSTALIAGYSSYSATKLGFRGTYAAVAQALSSVTWNPNTASGDISVRIGMASAAGANEFYDANSSHYYRYVSTPTPWAQARAIAENEELFGLQGYLAEIGSAAENAFIGTETSATNIWIGATEDAGTAVNPSANPYDGSPGKRWIWEGALETPLPSGSGASALGLGSSFSSWADNEPNNDSPRSADCAVTNWGSGIGFWNDLPCSNAQGYLIEFGGRPNDVSSASTRTITATVVAKEAVVLGTFRNNLTCTFDVDCSFPLSITNPTAKNSADVDLAGTFSYVSSNTVSTTVDAGIAGASISVVRAGESIITVTFTPTDTTLYASSSKSFTVTVVSSSPGSATALRATAGNTNVDLTWTPGSNGGSDITDYRVEYSTNNSTWSTFADGTGVTPAATVTGLTNGVLYYFKVSAISVVGTGPVSASISATPVAPADPPSPVILPAPPATPVPSVSPSPSSAPKPTPVIPANPVTLSAPAKVESGSLANPAGLVERLIQNLNEFMKPVTVDIFASPKPNAPKLADQAALNLVTATADKKVAKSPSLLLFDDQYQPTKLVILDKTVAQVVAPTGGVISVQAKNGAIPIAVSTAGRVQMLKSNSVVAQGDGLAPNTEFAVYLFSKPTLLGIGKTNGRGEFFVSFPVKKNIPLGDHTLQVNGLLSDGRVSSVSMPVRVVDSVESVVAEEAADTNPAYETHSDSGNTEAPYLATVSILFLIMIVLFAVSRLIWVVTRRRRKRDEQT